jgi:hypothetical protein
LGLRGGGSRGASAQLLTRCLASPGSRIDLAHHTQPLLGFRERGEITHVEAEALTSLFEAATYKKGKPLQLGHVDLGECHRGGR